MSRIQQIQPNYQPKNLKQIQPGFAYSPSFAGKVSAAQDFTKEVADEVAARIHKNMSLPKRAINRLSKFMTDTDGEVQNNLASNIFTATLAPLMINYNPFSKSDEKTRAYSAWRQPVSAVIQVTAGLAMTIGINHFMDKLGSEGHLPFIDSRMEPAKDYLKAQFKNDLKNSKDKKKFLEDCKPDKRIEVEVDSNGMPKGKYKKACIAGYVDNVKKQRKELFTALIGENPKNIKIKDKQILLNGKKLAENVPGLETKEQLEKYLKENNLHNRTFGDFMKENFKFEFYDDKTLKQSVLETKLFDVKALNFLKAIGLVGNKTEGKKGLIDEPELNRILAGIRQNEQTEKQMREAIGSGIDAKKLANATGQQAASMDRLQVGGGSINTPKITLEQLLYKLGYPKDKVQDLMDKKMSVVLNEFAAKLKTGGNKSFNLKAGIKEFAENMVTNSISIIGKNSGNYKKYTAIFFNLFTTMISCSILNWSYPRIMEKFFPELVKSDKPKQPEAQKGGNK